MAARVAVVVRDGQFCPSFRGKDATPVFGQPRTVNKQAAEVLICRDFLLDGIETHENTDVW